MSENMINKHLTTALYHLRKALEVAEAPATRDGFAIEDIKNLISDVKYVLDREPVTTPERTQQVIKLDGDKTKTYEQLENDRIVWLNKLRENGL